MDFTKSGPLESIIFANTFTDNRDIKRVICFEGGKIMNQQLTELELENLRHIIGGHGTLANKLETYAQACTDPELKTMLQRDAQSARQSQQQLLTFLG